LIDWYGNEINPKQNRMCKIIHQNTAKNMTRKKTKISLDEKNIYIK